MVTKNPYKFMGPLDPIKDKTVCIPRQEEVTSIVRGSDLSDYWVIIGPRQIGKTTFLRQIQHNCPAAHFVYFNFEVSPYTEEDFYTWLRDILLEEIPSEPMPVDRKDKNLGPGLEFLNFLMDFKPRIPEGKKIVFLFDEIELIPDIRNFLRIWRKANIDRYSKSQLNRYGVLITGSVDLIKETEGETSPFNIANTLYLTDFSADESQWLIDEPFKELNIKIEKAARDKLIHQVGGNPQLLQHACHKLVNTAYKQKRTIGVTNVDETSEYLFKRNSNLATLMKEVKSDYFLEDLLRRIIKGEKIIYLPYKEYSIAGTGPISEDTNRCCTIRNPLYRKFLRDIFEIYPIEIPQLLICYTSQDEKWLKQFFKIPDFDDFQKMLFLWEEKRNKPFDEWYYELQEKIGNAQLTILLVSDNSLTDDFLLKKEIRDLIIQSEKEGKHIFKLLVPGTAGETIHNLAGFGV